MNWNSALSKVGSRRQPVNENSNSIPPSWGIAILLRSPSGDNSKRTDFAREAAEPAESWNMQRYTEPSGCDGFASRAGSILEQRRESFM